MTGRDKILARIQSNQPRDTPSSLVQVSPTFDFDPITRFKDTLVSIGGRVIPINNETEIRPHLSSLQHAKGDLTIVGPDTVDQTVMSSHAFQHVDVAILRGDFAVAENGAIWITDKSMIDRALPFICLNLVLIVRKTAIVPTMHHAYDRIGSANYGLGTFIAGPSKTADIEQSLVLGAHGAKTLTCFLVD